MKKPIVLCIMDGLGYREEIRGNAVLQAKTPNLDRLKKIYPNTLIEASGKYVGLPEGQMGNSEVGHTNIGAGRIVYQDLSRIDNDINNGNIYNNEVINNIILKSNNLHIMGLLSDGGVHSHINHIKAIIHCTKKSKLDNVYIHIFTDGRDTDIHSGKNFTIEIMELIKKLKEEGDYPNIAIASISGRYYSMDRDNRWDRINLAYNAIANCVGNKNTDILNVFDKSYNSNITDEFIVPTIVTTKDYSIKNGDGVIFCNFRPDRARQLTKIFTQEEFTAVERNSKYDIGKINFVCMTEYDVKFKNVEIAYKQEKINNTLGEVLSKNNIRQLRAAETEKYAHVTFFFNGGVEKPNEGEDRLLVPSPKVNTYDLKPEMSAFELVSGIIQAIDLDRYEVIIVNFANPDMVGHTGDLNATIKAIETVDKCVGELFEKVLSLGGTGIITADHGNSELMLDNSNRIITTHTNNPVPLIIVGDKYKNKELIKDGKLSDIAPTILEMLNISKPKEMTGKSLFI